MLSSRSPCTQTHAGVRTMFSRASVVPPGRAAALARSTPGSRVQPAVVAAKGFSKKQKKSKKAQDEGGKKKEKRVKFKGKTTARMGAQRGPVIPEQRLQQAQFDTAQIEADRAEQEEAALGDADFEKRLAMISMEGEQKKQEVAQQKQSVLDGDIYSNPPPLTETLLGSPSPASSSAASSSEDGSGSFGPGKVAVTGISIFAAVAFVATSLQSDLVNSSPQPVSQAASARKMKKYEKEQAKEVVKGFEEKLKQDPNDLVALEGAGVTYAELGEYGKAIPVLKKLADAKPTDPDVLRLLAETQAANKDVKSALETYRKAEAAEPRATLEILQGVASTQVKNGQEAQAVNGLLEVRAQVEAGTKEADYSSYEVDLVLANIYSQWNGHNSDALKVYDKLIKAYPDDFRAYLAKGVLLKSSGQKGDAERMFIQAKYLAPKEAMSVVTRVIDQNK